jgi:hypothetical protein
MTFLRIMQRAGPARPLNFAAEAHRGGELGARWEFADRNPALSSARVALDVAADIGVDRGERDGSYRARVGMW